MKNFYGLPRALLLIYSRSKYTVTFNAMAFRIEGKQCRAVTHIGPDLLTLSAARDACKAVAGVTDWLIFASRGLWRPGGGVAHDRTDLVESTLLGSLQVPSAASESRMEGAR